MSGYYTCDRHDWPDTCQDHVSDGWCQPCRRNELDRWEVDKWDLRDRWGHEDAVRAKIADRQQASGEAWYQVIALMMEVADRPEGDGRG